MNYSCSITVIDNKDFAEDRMRILLKTVLLNILISCVYSTALTQSTETVTLTYPIVDTGVDWFFSNNAVISEPVSGDSFLGQDAHFKKFVPSYSDNGDGTATDNVTGLMWMQDMGNKMTFDNALEIADIMNFAGYNDWRIPGIKELYSLIQFTGINGHSTNEDDWIPYIDTNYFIQPFGDQNAGERLIDAQTWSATEYTGRTMNNDETVFGVNFVDGRIKGYPKYNPASGNEPNKMYFRFVRNNPEYGNNNFIDNNNGTITDLATGLMWQKADDGISRDWGAALTYSDELELGGYNDWRLPDAKELHSIVDYTRSPQATNSAAISSLFSITEINDPDGNPGQYPYFWTSTTHLDGLNSYDAAVYIAFGEAQGKMNNNLMDVHGAGAQRSDPKTGDPDNYPDYFGPQGDVRYVYNYVRSVRTVDTETSVKEDHSVSPVTVRMSQNYPNPFNPVTTIHYQIPQTAFITLKIYSVTGALVKTLVSVSQPAGIYDVLWDGTNSYGIKVSSGMYIYQMKAGTYSSVRKMLYLK